MTTNTILGAMSEWLYPPACAACGEFTRDVLCGRCEGTIRRLDGAVCPSCGRALPSGARRDAPCSMCRQFEYNFDTCRSAVSYEGAMTQLLKKFKYRQKTIFSGLLVAAMNDYLKARPELFDPARGADFIVPVPLHPIKHIQRGFNQSELLARGVARELKLPVRGALRRVRFGPPQAKMGWKERVENVNGAFAARGKVDGKRVLLVDDVVTTGATASECARVLKGAGAAEAHVFTLARRDWQ